MDSIEFGTWPDFELSPASPFRLLLVDMDFLRLVCRSYLNIPLRTTLRRLNPGENAPTPSLHLPS
jgi:hypothetical protein